MKNKNIALIIGGIALYMMMSRRNNYVPPTQQNLQNTPPPPPVQQGNSNAQAWAAWASTIINSFGQVAELWQPGGPFYNLPAEQQELVNQQALALGQGMLNWP